jgi:simple sugar transport system ATP-binding protein
MSILYGFYEADAGVVLIDGERHDIRVPRDAIEAGIGMVHQHFMLVGPFTVLENVILGAEGGARLRTGLDHARAELGRIEAEFGLEVPLDAPVASLPVGLQQRVEILKALYRGARTLILDEPTGVLTPQEVEKLFQILRSLRDRGVTIVLITHKLREIMAVTDNVSVMRAGAMVAHRRTADTGEEELAELMVGRKVLLRVEKQPREPGSVILEVEGLGVTDGGVSRLEDVTFRVHAGEIVGVAGVSGNGQSELLEVLSGMRPPGRGGYAVKGRRIDADHPLDAAAVRRLGVAHVPEDRLRSGLVREFPALESAILGYHEDPRYNGRVLMNGHAVEDECARMMAAFDVRPAEPRLRSSSFSGGNQQKLVLARELGREPDLLLVGQPTRGVDIGAIEFIHRELVAMRDAGKAVLLVSVELEEIMGLSDRIVVMFEGRIVGELDAAQATERGLGLMMANAA